MNDERFAWLRQLAAACFIGVGTGVGIEDDTRSLVMCICLVMAMSCVMGVRDAG